MGEFLNNAEHWRLRAQHMLATANDVERVEEKERLLKIVEVYDRLAERAEQGFVSAPSERKPRHESRGPRRRVHPPATIRP
jgi:hypothetical protein